MSSEELTPALAWYRHLVERVPIILYVEGTEPRSPKSYISPKIEPVLGHPRERFEDGDFWRTLLHPDDVDLEASVHAASEETGIYSAEFRLRAADGGWVWFHDEAVFVVGEGEMPDHWLGVLLDITSRKQMEDRLAEAEARATDLVSHIPALVYMQPEEPAFSSVYVSPQIEDVLGYPSEDFRDHRMWYASSTPTTRRPSWSTTFGRTGGTSRSRPSTG